MCANACILLYLFTFSLTQWKVSSAKNTLKIATSYKVGAPTRCTVYYVQSVPCRGANKEPVGSPVMALQIKMLQPVLPNGNVVMSDQCPNKTHSE